MRKLHLAPQWPALPLRQCLAADITVAVTAIVEHPALDAARDGIKEALAAEGFVDGNQINFVYQLAQGKPAIAAADRASKFVGDGATIIVPISTPSAQARGRRDQGHPDRVHGRDRPGGGADRAALASIRAATSPASPTCRRSPTPRADPGDHAECEAARRRLQSGRGNSVYPVERLKEVAAGGGFEIVESPATKSADVQQATLALVGKVDAIYIPTDNTVVSALEAAISVARRTRFRSMPATPTA